MWMVTIKTVLVFLEFICSLALFLFWIAYGSELRDPKNSSRALLFEQISVHLSNLLNQGTDSFKVKAN